MTVSALVVFARIADAGDAFLAILTNGKVTEGGVQAHIDLLAEFSYLGPPRVPAAWSKLLHAGVDLAVDGGRNELNRRD